MVYSRIWLIGSADLKRYARSNLCPWIGGDSLGGTPGGNRVDAGRFRSGGSRLARRSATKSAVANHAAANFAVHWGGGRVHPKIELIGPKQWLRQPLDHYIDRDLADMMARLNRYTDLAALDAAEVGRAPHLAGGLHRIFSRGWKSYVTRRGYREGAVGLALALFAALYPLLTELKLAFSRDQGPDN